MISRVFFLKDDEFSEADDDAYYRDDGLDLDFERFHIRHGNREIGSSASEESDDDDEFGEEEGLVHSRLAALLISRVFFSFLKIISVVPGTKLAVPIRFRYFIIISGYECHLKI